ncbi:MAG: hypothetical protein ACE5GT_15530 [Rhodospirillales bacterium]
MFYFCSHVTERRDRTAKGGPPVANDAFIKEFLTLGLVFLAGYALLIVA